jgi:hypothetical protein
MPVSLTSVPGMGAGSSFLLHDDIVETKRKNSVRKIAGLIRFMMIKLYDLISVTLFRRYKIHLHPFVVQRRNLDVPVSFTWFSYPNFD